MTTITAPATARHFGRCLAAGCKHRHVIDVELDHTGTPVLRDPDTGEGLNFFDAARFRYRGHADLRILCPDHRVFLSWTALTATHNPEKVCNGRCMGATGPSCDCSCGGENHGSAHLAI